MINSINDYVYNTFTIEPININVVGGYSNEKGIMSLIVIPTNKYNLIIQKIKKIDNNVFYDVLDGYELNSLQKVI